MIQHLSVCTVSDEDLVLTHLCPSFCLCLCQSTYNPAPLFISRSTFLCLLGSMQQLLLLQSYPCVLPPPTLPLFLCPAFSFIHILLAQQQQSRPIELERSLIIISISLCFYLHSSIFPSCGDFTFISSSFALHSSLFLRWCLSVSSFFYPLIHVRLIALLSSSPIRAL